MSDTRFTDAYMSSKVGPGPRHGTVERKLSVYKLRERGKRLQQAERGALKFEGHEFPALPDRR
eukprot:9919642-Lingulodinium_polyedra.AAC.1